jgi:hypothetical protein
MKYWKKLDGFLNDQTAHFVTYMCHLQTIAIFLPPPFFYLNKQLILSQIFIPLRFCSHFPDSDVDRKHFCFTALTNGALRN